MTDDIQQVRETTTQSGDTVQKITEVKKSRDEATHLQNVVEKLIWYVAGVLLVLLGFRFLLSLLGANTSNSFANFIYRLSHPFVAPFFGLFNYKTKVTGTSHFEIYTLVAMLVYIVVAWGIVELVSLNRE